ncbi:MAG: arginine--tRNA ligase [Patescibacteria group bacterium]|jgi:arginyl-tRNA synthetase
MYALDQAKKEILLSLKKALGKTYSVTPDMLVTPPKPEYGDLSFPCFDLAKGMKRNPAEIAIELSAKMAPMPLVPKITALGPYVNFTFDDVAFTEHVLSDISKMKARYGKSTTGKGKKVLVEYVNFNTHKEVHVGHLRNLTLGKAVVNILRMNGFDVTPVSYINDLGNNVARCLWGLIHLHPGEEPQGDKLNFLGRVYTEATLAIGEDEAKRAQVSEIQRKLENMEGDVVPLWKKTHKWSMDGMKEIFGDFALELDKIYLEHEIIADTHEIVKRLLTEGIARVSEGAVIVDLEAEGLGVNLLRKSDGTLLYNAKDLALAYRKETDYAADRSIIVVDARQALAFKQLSATLKRMDFPREVIHLAFDFVTLPEGAMSSRKGNIVRWTELRDAMKEKLVESTKTRHPEWRVRKIEATARALTYSAVTFMMLRQDPDKIITFDMDEAMATDGFTGPYLLYTIARIESIKKKAPMKLLSAPALLTHEKERELMRLLAKYPLILAQAGAQYRPSTIAQYGFDLAQKFAGYYEVARIIDESNPELSGARLALADAVRQVLANLCEVLGLVIVKEM